MVDLVVFGDAAAARNGLTAMPVNTGEDFYKINSTNYLVPQVKKSIIAALATSADESKITQWRFHRTEDADWNDFGTFNVHGQDLAFTLDQIPRLSYPIPAGKQIAAELGNTNTSQVDAILLFLASSSTEDIQFGNSGPFKLPDGYGLYRFTGSTTLGAGVLTDVSLTAVTFNPDDNAKYHICGASGWSATGHAARLKHRQGGTQGIRPGFIMGDDATPSTGLWTWQDFGTFTGTQYPIVQTLAGAGDTAQEYIFAIKKVG